MSTDRELLELAAKAAGHTIQAMWEYEDGSSWYAVVAAGDGFGEDFDPLNDDGDALRLAVKLRINIEHQTTMGGKSVGFNVWPVGRGDCAAVGEGLEASDLRRAIVRAAAEIGRSTNAS